MFKVGQKVRVKKDGDEDSQNAAGRLGTVVRADVDTIDGTPKQSLLLTFPRWAKGHSGDDSKGKENRSFWYVNAHNVVLVKAKKARRKKS